MEIPTDLLSILLGPLGVAVVAIIAVRALWARCQKLEAELAQVRERAAEELKAEREGRLRDAQATADRLLGTWGKVAGAIDTLERLSSLDLPALSLPPEKEPRPP